jgi:hypothetical protein
LSYPGDPKVGEAEKDDLSPGRCRVNLVKWGIDASVDRTDS